MRRSTRLLSTYSSDIFGMCSALYELGGLVIMHDASGCNSTYCTHDEPRWFDVDSMLYISALTEEDIIMGQDEKLIEDAVSAVEEARAAGRMPRFVAIGGSPMPFMIGCDLQGVAREIAARTGLPALGLECGGIKDYTSGAGDALAWIADTLCTAALKAEDAAAKRAELFSHLTKSGTPPRLINILGVTPLDFSWGMGNGAALAKYFAGHGAHVISTWAMRCIEPVEMGCTLDIMAMAGIAERNVVVSAVGLRAAKRLEAIYGTPYTIGCPISASAIRRLIPQDGVLDGALIIGEAVFAHSLRQCLEADLGAHDVRILCPLQETCGLLRDGDVNTCDEGEIMAAMSLARTIIADPIYRRALPPQGQQGKGAVCFAPFPHEAYSGRMYRDQIPMFIGEGAAGDAILTGW